MSILVKSEKPTPFMGGSMSLILADYDSGKWLGKLRKKLKDGARNNRTESIVPVEKNQHDQDVQEPGQLPHQ